MAPTYTLALTIVSNSANQGIAQHNFPASKFPKYFGTFYHETLETQLTVKTVVQRTPNTTVVAGTL